MRKAQCAMANASQRPMSNVLSGLPLPHCEVRYAQSFFRFFQRDTVLRDEIVVARGAICLFGVGSHGCTCIEDLVRKSTRDRSASVQKLRHLDDVAGEEKQSLVDIKGFSRRCEFRLLHLDANEMLNALSLSPIAGSHPAKKGIWPAAALAAPYTPSRT